MQNKQRKNKHLEMLVLSHKTIANKALFPYPTTQNINTGEEIKSCEIFYHMFIHIQLPSNFQFF